MDSETGGAWVGEGSEGPGCDMGGGVEVHIGVDGAVEGRWKV